MSEIQSNKKVKRRIILIYDFSDSANNALRFAVKLCEVLKSELLILNIQKNKDFKTNDNKILLYELISNLKQSYNFDIEGLVINGKIKKIFVALYEKYEGIMFVVGQNNKHFTNQISFKLFLNLVRNSKIPWLSIPENAELGDFSKIVLPISYTRQNKEKIAWASYFYRLHNTTINAVSAQGKDGFIKIGISNNVLFLKKMYNTLEVEYNVLPTEKTIHEITNYSLEYANQINAALTIELISNSPDIFDLLFGPQERNFIFNNFKIPVLCINPLDDMYVICN